MKLYIDIGTGEVRRTLNGQRASGLVFYLRDILNPLEISFVQDGVITTGAVLAGGAIMRVGLKAASGGSLLAGTSAYTVVGDAAQVLFSLNTTQLLAYFSSHIPPGGREGQFLFEVETSNVAGTIRETRLQEVASVRRDINEVDDGDPTAVADGLYVLKGALFNDAGHPINPWFACARGDVTSYALARAITTAGLSVPTLFLFFVNDGWESWTLRAKGGSGENDDGVTYLVPADHDPVTNNVVLKKTAIQ